MEKSQHFTKILAYFQFPYSQVPSVLHTLLNLSHRHLFRELLFPHLKNSSYRLVSPLQHKHTQTTMVSSMSAIALTI